MSGPDSPLRNNISLPTLLVSFALVLGSAALLLNNIQQQVDAARMELRGIDSLRDLQQIMIDLQQLRGLNAILINGDPSVDDALAVVRSRLLQRLKHTKNTPTAIEFGLQSEVDGFLSEFQTFLDGPHHQSPDWIFEQLTRFVDQLRDLMLQAGNRSTLILDAELVSYYLVDLLLNRLPSLIESLGRIRGMGSGALAGAGEISADLGEQQRLLEVTRVELGHTERDLRLVFDSDSRLRFELKIPFHSLKSSIAGYLSFVGEIGSSPAKTIQPKEFFDKGTAAIDVALVLCQQVREQLQYLLRSRIQGLETRKWLAFASLVLALLLTGPWVARTHIRERQLLTRIENERRFSGILIDKLPGIFYLLDEKNQFIRWNQGLEQISGYSKQDVSNLRPQQLIVTGAGDDMTVDAGAGDREGLLRTKSGFDIPIYTSSYPFNTGKNRYLAGFALDMTANKAERARLKKLAITDGLTGLFNRARFDDDLERAVELANRYQRPFSLIAVDIDHFKQVNDNFGHATGDKVLRRLVELAGDCARVTDAFYRYGGEEFMIILPETDIRGTVTRAERLRQYVESADFGQVGRVTVSLGVTEYKHPESAESLFKRADDALYAAKDLGRNRVEIGA